MGDLIVLSVIGIVVAGVIASLVKNRKAGSPCSGCAGCAGCPGGCASCAHACPQKKEK